MTVTYIIIGAAFLITALIYFKSKSSGNIYNNISVADLEQLPSDKNIILIDVRTQKEMSHGKIDNAIEIELGLAMNK